MTKTVTIENTGSQFLIPAKAYQAADLFRSKEQARYYLNGVFLHQTEEGVILVATNDDTLLKIELPSEAFIGEHLQIQMQNGEGVGAILSLDVTEKAFKAKALGELWIYGDVSTGLAHFVDVIDAEEIAHARLGITEFDRIDGTFPDYTRVIPTVFNGDGCEHFSFNPDLVQMFSKAHSLISGVKTSAISFKMSGSENPALVSFSGCPEMVGVIAPMRFK